jgi:hypothetical protein
LALDPGGFADFDGLDHAPRPLDRKALLAQSVSRVRDWWRTGRAKCDSPGRLVTARPAAYDAELAVREPAPAPH